MWTIDKKALREAFKHSDTVTIPTQYGFVLEIERFYDGYYCINDRVDADDDYYIGTTLDAVIKYINMMTA